MNSFKASEQGEDENTEASRRLEVHETASQKLKVGFDIMRHLGWAFPINHQNTSFDTATRGFISVFEATKWLDNHFNKYKNDTTKLAEISKDLEPFVPEWSNLLNFLASMYSCK